MTQPIDAADLAEDSRWNAGVDYAITQLCVMLGVDPAKINWDAATETLDGDVMSVLGNALRAAYGDEWSSSSLNTACIRAALARPAVNAVGVAGLDPSPFITATSKGDGKTYYVTVKVRSIAGGVSGHLGIFAVEAIDVFPLFGFDDRRRLAADKLDALVGYVVHGLIRFRREAVALFGDLGHWLLLGHRWSPLSGAYMGIGRLFNAASRCSVPK